MEVVDEDAGSDWAGHEACPVLPSYLATQMPPLPPTVTMAFPLLSISSEDAPEGIISGNSAGAVHKGKPLNPSYLDIQKWPPENPNVGADAATKTSPNGSIATLSAPYGG